MWIFICKAESKSALFTAVSVLAEGSLRKRAVGRERSIHRCRHTSTV